RRGGRTCLRTPEWGGRIEPDVAGQRERNSARLGRAMTTTHMSLLERMKSRQNQSAWAEFVSLYTPLLYHWACRLGPRSEANALVQDTLLLLLRKMPEFVYDPGKRFRGWLWTLTRNKFLENARSAVPLERAGVDQLAGLADPDGVDLVSEAEHRR